MSRRSSLLRQQAEKDGMDINDLIRPVFPGGASSNTGRHTGSLVNINRVNSSHVSLAQDSLHPTPCTSRPRSAEFGTAPKRQHAGIPLSSAQTGRTQLYSRLPLKPPVSNLKNKAAAVERNVQSCTKSVSRIPTSTQKRRLPRASSVESLAWSSLTPRATPRSGFSSPHSTFNSAHCKMFEPKTDMMQKTLKAPEPQERRKVNVLFARVHEFLDRHNFPNLRSMKNYSIQSVTGTEYNNMCQFTLRMMMGQGFLANLKNDTTAVSAKLIEISAELKYPGTISKSVLKSPNTPHQWPTALMFLAWLTLTVEMAIQPQQAQPSISELVNPEQHIYKLARQSALELYYHYQADGAVSEELVQEQIEIYREGIVEIYGVNSSIPYEDLVSVRDEKLEQLSKLDKHQDPREEVLSILNSRNDEIRALQEAEAELESLKIEYSDLEKFKTKIKSLNESSMALESKISSLVNAVAEQEIDKDTEKRILNETMLLRSQRETVEQVVSNMMQEFDKRERQTKYMHTRFCEMCTHLSISDAFNDFIHRLELKGMLENMERIPRNPFTPAELKPWLKTVRRVRKHTRKILDDLEKHFTVRLDEVEKCISYCERREAEINKIIAEHQLEIESLEKYSEQLLRQMEAQIASIDEEIADCGEEIADLDNLNSNNMQEVEMFRRKVAKIQNREQSLIDDFNTLASKIEAAEEEFCKVRVFICQEKQKRNAYFTERMSAILNDYPKTVNTKDTKLGVAEQQNKM